MYICDQVVPGYYLRRNKEGAIENSTCVNNTASEHYMVDRLIVDDLLHWAKDYKVVRWSRTWRCFFYFAYFLLRSRFGVAGGWIPV